MAQWGETDLTWPDDEGTGAGHYVGLNTLCGADC